jgi:hypothetical protein
MKIVIDIDEDVFTRLFDNGTEDYAIANDDLFSIAKSIRKGTPLPGYLNKIKDEIELKQYSFMANNRYDEGVRFGLMMAYQIINKYLEGSDSECQG